MRLRTFTDINIHLRMQSELNLTNQNKARISQGAPKAKLTAASSAGGSEVLRVVLARFIIDLLY